MKKVNEVIVVGAGPSGLVLANSLKLMGIQKVSLIGKQDHTDRGLGIWPNAQSALSKLGIINKIDHRFIPSAAYRDDKGNWLSKCSETESNSKRVMTVRQNSMLNALRQRAIKEKVVMIDDQVKSVNNGVITSSGSEKFTADVIVGADGTNSIVRKQILSDTYEESNQMCLSAILDEHSSPSEYPFETLGSCKQTGLPIRFACIPLPGLNSKFWFATIPKIDYNDKRGLLLEKFSQFHDPIPDLISYTFDNSIEVYEEYFYSQNRLSLNNHLDNVCIIGDAWHGLFAGHNLAQGTSVGIEDAWEMAHALANHNQDQAFKIFIQKRRNRIIKYGLFSKFTKQLSDADGYGYIGSSLRNSMRFVPNPINSMIFDFSLNQSLGRNYKLSPFN